MLATTLIPLAGEGPEDVACLPSGELITGCADGRILKIHYRVMHSYGFKSFTNSHIFTQYNGRSECNCLLSYISICFKF